MNGAYLGYKSIGELKKIDKKILFDFVEKNINKRLSEIPRDTVYDKDNRAHQMKFISGIIQIFGALSFEEIRILTKKFELNVSDSDIRQFLVCLKSARWIRKTKISSGEIYIFSGNQKPLSFSFKNKDIIKSRTDLENSIREGWKSLDQERFSEIAKMMAEGVQ